MKQECLGYVGFGIFDLGGDFVAVVVKVEMEDVELVVKLVENTTPTPTIATI